MPRSRQPIGALHPKVAKKRIATGINRHMVDEPNEA